MTRVIDSFLYNGEKRLLEIRLYELAPVVEEFLLVEAATTFAGVKKSPKDLFHPDEFSGYNISSVLVTLPFDKGVYPAQFRTNEIALRNHILDGFTSNHMQDDIVLVSDVDEIPSRELVTKLRDRPKRLFPVKIEQRTSYYYLNYIAAEPIHTKYCSTAVLLGDLIRVSPEMMRGALWDERMPFVTGGWHFSFLGDDDWIKTKVEGYAHTEFNTDAVKDHIGANRRVGYDPLGTGKRLRRMDIDDTFPHLVREQPERFSDIILPE